AHAGHAGDQPVHQRLRAAGHGEPERRHGARRARQPRLGLGPPVPAGAAPPEARQSTPVLHGEVGDVGRHPVRGLHPQSALEVGAMSGVKRVMLWVMGIFYVVAGLAHFVRTDYYLPMMPAYLPAHRELVLLSGVAEVVLGIAVLIPQPRRPPPSPIIPLLTPIFPPH